MTRARICWDWPALTEATQIDAGAMQVGDPRADAVFLAVHQPVPIGRITGELVSIVSEKDLLSEFVKVGDLNQPLLLFVTGDVGSGKSHMVRWLRSSIGERPNWHVVYVEKRNTSLTRVIEKIIEGLDSGPISQIRDALNDAGAESQTLEQAQLRLLNELRVLVQTDEAESVLGRSASHEKTRLDGVVLKAARENVRVLIGDLHLSDYLQRPGGPIERITKLAMPRTSDTDDEVSEVDVRLDEHDLIVEGVNFSDLNQTAAQTVRALSNTRVRTAVAQLLNHYLPRAKARVFAGRNTNLLELFAEVRREIESQGKELCLFIEDLVLLHGVDKELAHALTIPAAPGLCRVRTAIAVTSGYLRSIDTFEDRGERFTMDVATNTVAQDDQRSFVARYLNVSRLGLDVVAEAIDEIRNARVPNGCSECSVRTECHDAFGASTDGFGYFPFNGNAIGQLTHLVSSKTFRPRDILRRVIRAGVQVADNELKESGTFPSKRFASELDPNRQRVPVATQQFLEGFTSSSEQEITLRNFYSEHPPKVTAELARIAKFLDIELSELPKSPEKDDRSVSRPPPTPSSTMEESAFDRWFLKGTRLPAADALKMRAWFFNQLYLRLETGDHGHLVTKKDGLLIIGGVTVSRDRSFEIENSGGGGGGQTFDGPKHVFKRTASTAKLFADIAAVESKKFSTDDNGSWYFLAMDVLDDFAGEVVAAADAFRQKVDPEESIIVLRLLGRLSAQGADDGVLNVSGLFRRPTGGADAGRTTFVNETDRMRRNALDALRLSFTQAQGNGASSLLDAGGLYKELSATTNLSKISGTKSTAVLEALRGFHVRFATDAWRPLINTFDQVLQHLDPGEDFGKAWTDMRELVNLANNAGLLPRQDSKTRFEEALEELPHGVDSSWRFVARHRNSDDLETLVWDIPNDCLIHLQKLQRLSEQCVSILDHIERSINLDARPHVEASREAISAEFLKLCNLLDDVVKS
jgi:hypothetical protein